MNLSVNTEGENKIEASANLKDGAADVNRFKFGVLMVFHFYFLG